MVRLRVLLLVIWSAASLASTHSLSGIERAGPWIYLRDGQSVSPGETTVEVLAVGDINLGRGMVDISDPFAESASWLRSADLTLGNLECAIGETADSGRSPIGDRWLTADNRQQQGREPYVLVAPAGSVEKLVGAGFDLLGLANNHSLDAGRAGLVETVNHLRAHGIEPVGAGADGQEASAPVIRTVKGVRLAFLAFNMVADGEDRKNPSPLPETGRSEGFPFPSREGGRGVRFIANWDPKQSLAAVRQARQSADAVIVSIHWGYEYERHRDPAQEAIAQALLDAGAVVVLGHHPHVAQEVRVYNQGSSSSQLVAFSLGNFAFDQAFGDTHQGLALRLFLDHHGLRAAQALPVSVGLRPRLMEAGEGASLLARVLPDPALPAVKSLAFTCDKDTCTPIKAQERWGSGNFTKGLVDLTGDGQPEEVRLERGHVSIFEKGMKTWESPPEWRVSDLATGDPDGDGREDLMLALWKPDKQGILRSHPFVLGYRGGLYRTIWGGSAVGRLIHEVELGDLDGDGIQELIVLEEIPGGKQRTISVWRWHGWGFRCDWRSSAGDFTNLQFVSGTKEIKPNIQIEKNP